ncbi:MAG: winged helix-turn-helix domain-containing protein [Sphingomonas sp.]
MQAGDSTDRAEIRLADEPDFRLGDMQVRPSTRELIIGSDREILEPRVMQVLTLLAGAQGRVVSRDELIDRCWGGRIVTENALTRVISRVRRLSELDDGRSFTLETIPRVGYGLKRAAEPAGGDRPLDPHRRRYIAASALGVGAAALGGALWLRRGPARKVRIAVLPFDAVDPALRLQASGISEDLIGALAAIPDLDVVARASSFALDRTGKADAAKRLGATHLLDGAIQRENDAIMVSVYLVDGASASTIWSDRYRAPASEMPLIQRRIIRDVVGVLRLTLSDAAGPASIDPSAYRLFLEGRNLLGRDPPDPAAAIPLLQQAVARAPDFSRGWSALGAAYVAMQGPVDEAAYTPFARAEARAAARRAIRLDPRNGEALAMLGAAFDRAGHWDLIERLHSAALRSEPSNIDALYVAGSFYADVGWAHRSIAVLRRACALDPLNPGATFLLVRVLEAAEGTGHEVDALLADAQARWSDNRSLWRFATRRAIWQHNFPAAERLIAHAPKGAEGDAGYFADLLAGMRDPHSPRIDTFLAPVRGGPLPYTWPIFVFALGMLGQKDACVAFIRRIFLSPTGRQQAPTWVLHQAMVRDAVATPGVQDVLRQLGLVDFWRVRGRD